MNPFFADEGLRKKYDVLELKNNFFKNKSWNQNDYCKEFIKLLLFHEQLVILLKFESIDAFKTSYLNRTFNWSRSTTDLTFCVLVY